jgi:hypothetical protein
VDDRAEVEFFRGEKGETLAQIEAFLRAENGDRAGAGAVGFWPTIFKDEPEEAVVLLHGRPPEGP